jgi:hypothetical protein
MALTANLLFFKARSGPADAVWTQLAKPVLVLSALPNADTTDLDPSIRWQAGMQGLAATICIPVAADAPIVLYL